MPGSPHFVSHQIRWTGFIEAGLFAGLAGSWLGLLGHWHWMLDLCSHFRWQGAAVALVALTWAAWRKRRWMTGGAMLTLLLNAALWLQPGQAEAPGKASPDFHVHLVAYNVLTSNQNHAGVLGWLQKTDADIIFLMEVDRVWAKALEPLKRTHPHFLIEARSDNFGLALFSRLPAEKISLLGSDTLYRAGEPGAELFMDSIEVRLKTGGREWTFVGTHPVPPMGGAYAAARDGQLRALARHCAALNQPVLVAGDLNASPWSHGFRQLTAGSLLRPAPGAWEPSWRAGSLLGVPIDHALCSGPLVFKRRIIGPDLGSDHRPQWIELGWME